MKLAEFIAENRNSILLDGAMGTQFKGGNRMKLAEQIADEKKILLVDGAMGTQLAASGVPMGGQSCITHPEAVLAVHRKYVEAGAEIIITNTFTMNRISIETHNIGVDVREVNLAGVKLARQAAVGGQFVLGDMTSTGKLLKPNGPVSEDAAYETYLEQAAILLEGGVDGFIIETMIDLKETVCALKACRKVADLPVITSISFDTAERGGRNIMGDTAEKCARVLTEAGADVIGANCGSIDPYQMAEIVAMMKKATLVPIIAQPNAGRPKVVNGETVFNMTPGDFGAGIKKCLEAGAKLVGGCCGTSPAHIKAVADFLGK